MTDTTDTTGTMPLSDAELSKVGGGITLDNGIKRGAVLFFDEADAIKGTSSGSVFEPNDKN